MIAAVIAKVEIVNRGSKATKGFSNTRPARQREAVCHVGTGPRNRRSTAGLSTNLLPLALPH
jgi:hypothetical protein